LAFAGFPLSCRYVLTRFSIAACVALLAAPALFSQAPPLARPVEPALQADPGNDLFARAQNMYESARSAQARETQIDLYQRAIPVFEDYLRQFPNHPNAASAYYFLGQCHFMTGAVDLGKRSFQIVLDRYPQSGRWVAAAAYQLGVDLYTRKEYQLAAPFFEKVAANAVRPEDRQRALFYLATCHHLVGSDAKAIIAYNRLIADPDPGNAYLDRSRLAVSHLLVKAAKPAEALTNFEMLANGTTVPEIRGEATLHAGLLAASLKKHDLAEAYLRKILTTPDLAKFRPQAQTALMGNEFEKGNFKEVISLFRRSEVKAEGATEARRMMLAGLAYMKLEKWPDALATFREVERAVPAENPLAFEASYNRLLCFFNIDGKHVPEQVDGFLEIYRKGRPQDPKIHTALMMKAEALYASGNAAAAAEVYGSIDAALVSDSNRPGLLYQRGWAMADSGDHQRAIASLTTFIEKCEKDPRLPKALAKRGDSFLKVGDPKAALRDFDRLITMQDQPEAKDLASFAWQRSAVIKKDEGDIDAMVSRYQSLVTKFPKLEPTILANAHYWIGWGQFKANKPEEAEPHLRLARELDGPTYAKQAGLLLVLSLFSRQDVPTLAKEVDLAIDSGSSTEVPEQVYRWLGNQVFNADDFTAAARYLTLGSTASDPRQTPKAVWRLLGKSLIEIKKPKDALTPIENLLAVEEQPQWKADAFLDKARALLALERLDEAEAAAGDGTQLRPEGVVDAKLRLTIGDIEFARKKFQEAANHYVVVAQLLTNDRELEPLALDKARSALDKAGNPTEAAKYRQRLTTEFPDYKIKD
jgi:tetratricopeptide (TPR) repeat protein